MFSSSSHESLVQEERAEKSCIALCKTGVGASRLRGNGSAATNFPLLRSAGTRDHYFGEFGLTVLHLPTLNFESGR